MMLRLANGDEMAILRIQSNGFDRMGIDEDSLYPIQAKDWFATYQEAMPILGILEIDIDFLC